MASRAQANHDDAQHNHNNEKLPDTAIDRSMLSEMDANNNGADANGGELDAEAARELARVMEGIAGGGADDGGGGGASAGDSAAATSTANARRRPTLNKTGAVKQLVPRSSNPALNASGAAALPQRSGSLSVVAGGGGSSNAASGTSTPTVAPTSPSQTRREVPASDVSMSGWLVKKSQKRWFVLQVALNAVALLLLLPARLIVFATPQGKLLTWFKMEQPPMTSDMLRKNGQNYIIIHRQKGKLLRAVNARGSASLSFALRCLCLQSR